MFIDLLGEESTRDPDHLVDLARGQLHEVGRSLIASMTRGHLLDAAVSRLVGIVRVQLPEVGRSHLLGLLDVARSRLAGIVRVHLHNAAM